MRWEHWLFPLFFCSDFNALFYYINLSVFHVTEAPSGMMNHKKTNMLNVDVWTKSCHFEGHVFSVWYWSDNHKFFVKRLTVLISAWCQQIASVAISYNFFLYDHLSRAPLGPPLRLSLRVQRSGLLPANQRESAWWINDYDCFQPESISEGSSH